MTETDARDGRDRIRDAAISQFARLGFAGASVRSIAAEAGVTPGLIVHHFGTKAALRDACDARVLEVLMGPERSTNTGVLAARLMDAGPVPYVAYLTGMLRGEPERADAVFDRILEATRGVVSEQRAAGLLNDDVADGAFAALLAVYGLAPLLLPRQLARAFGREELTPEVLSDAATALSDVLTRGAYKADPLRGAREGA